MTQYIFQFNTFNLIRLCWESLSDFDVDDSDSSSSSFLKLTRAGTILSNYIVDILPSQHIHKIEGVSIPSYRWGNWPHVYVKYLLFSGSLHLYEYFC